MTYKELPGQFNQTSKYYPYVKKKKDSNLFKCPHYRRGNYKLVSVGWVFCKDNFFSRTNESEVMCANILMYYRFKFTQI